MSKTLSIDDFFQRSSTKSSNKPSIPHITKVEKAATIVLFEDFIGECDGDSNNLKKAAGKLRTTRVEKEANNKLEVSPRRRTKSIIQPKATDDHISEENIPDANNKSSKKSEVLPFHESRKKGHCKAKSTKQVIKVQKDKTDKNVKESLHCKRQKKFTKTQVTNSTLKQEKTVSKHKKTEKQLEISNSNSDCIRNGIILQNTKDLCPIFMKKSEKKETCIEFNKLTSSVNKTGKVVKNIHDGSNQKSSKHCLNGKPSKLSTKSKNKTDDDCMVISVSTKYVLKSKDSHTTENKMKRKQSKDSDSVDATRAKKHKSDTAVSYVQQWSAKYQPCDLESVLGNDLAKLTLLEILSQWKRRLKKELKELHNNIADSDEEYSVKGDKDALSSEDEEESANTCIITGPTGCGKTAAVYACAKQLGIEVLEINASSWRGSKQVMSLLQEASQSHHVIKNSHFTTGVNHGMEKVKSSTTLPKTFFVKATKANEKSADKLLSDQISLVLFDEVDAVLGVDKGFWQAVQWFVRESKRPVVLTTTSRDLVPLGDEKSHVISFRPPRQNDVAKLISRIVATEQSSSVAPTLVAVSSHSRDAYDVTVVGDVRASLLAAHFWLMPTTTAAATKGKTRSGKHRKRERNRGETNPAKNIAMRVLGLGNFPADTTKLGEILRHGSSAELGSAVDAVSHLRHHRLSSSARLGGVFLSSNARIRSNGERMRDGKKNTAPFSDNSMKSCSSCCQELKSWEKFLVQSSHCDVIHSSFNRKHRIRLDSADAFSTTNTCTFHDCIDDQLAKHTSEASHHTTTVFHQLQSQLQLRSIRSFQLETMAADEVVTCGHACHGDYVISVLDSDQPRLEVDEHLPKQDFGRGAERHLDYLPYVRAICRSEARRRSTQPSRRFYHYFQRELSHVQMAELASMFEQT